MKCLSILICLFLILSVTAQESLPGFVKIKGATFKPGRGANSSGDLVRLDTYEILDHPVTNIEYKKFVDETGHRSPLHWDGGSIPQAKENYPVIFVDRWDVDAYLKWLSKKDNLIYRLPTVLEYEYAARGGLVNNNYPWGNDSPDNQANFDAEQNRSFDKWEKYLTSARYGKSNGFKLYGMAGNVWQMCTTDPDPATSQWKYRIDDPIELERSIMGGSWARSKSYLLCGYRLGSGPGIRHPDIGFRPVRQPQEAIWRKKTRKLTAVALEDRKVYLSWALLADDPTAIGFNIYRASERSHAGFKINETLITESTTFIDTNLETDKRYQYYVQPVDKNEKIMPRSEWAGITVSDKNLYMVNSFSPIYKQGSLVPIFGDLNGDGTLDCVIRMNNGNSEMSQDPGYPVQLEAFSSWGRSLWRKDLCNHDFCYGSANNVPFNVWDMDEDGRAEIICRLQQGDEVFVAILDGMTGKVKHKTPWPKMVSDFAKSSTRIHLSIAYLDGKNPAVITQTGLYENEVFTAYDNELNKMWQFNSFSETNGSGGHKIEVADVDGDGKQEIFNGTTCLNVDGTLRWSIYKQHPDIVSIHDYLPERPGLEIFYIVESSLHAGVYLVDANSGEIIWKVNREDDPRWTHGHSGWTANIWDGSPGIECVSNRAGHDDRNLILFSAAGKELLEPFPHGYTPIEWDGDETRELFKNGIIGNFDGNEVIPITDNQPILSKNSQILMVADLYGDFRDELILTETDGEGMQSIRVLTATFPVKKRFLTQTVTLDYQLWLGRNMGGGYRSVYDQALQKPNNEH